MGLDMFLYQARKPEVDAEEMSDIFEERWLSQHDYTYFIVEDMDEEEKEMVKDLLPFCVEVSVNCEEYDYDKLKMDYGLEENAYCCMISGNVMVYTNPGGPDAKKVEITDEEFDAYRYFVVKKAFVTKLSEIEYWRKNYYLREAIHNACDRKIENCGYYQLNEEMAKAINRDILLQRIGRSEPLTTEDYDYLIVNAEDMEGIVYHEWY